MWKIVYLLWLSLLVGNVDLDKPQEYEARVFLSVETDLFLGRPYHIVADQEGLYFYDAAYERITQVDGNGDKRKAIGSKGRGPGEYQGVSGFWVLEDQYMAYDYNQFKFITYDFSGEVIQDVTIDANPLPGTFPITLEALNSSEVLVPTGGSHDAMAAVVDIRSDSLLYSIGEPLVEYTPYNREEVVQGYRSGEIPDVLLNQVILGSSPSGNYVFKQTTGILEKYDHSGTLLWEKNLVQPEQEDLFDHIAETNRNMVDSSVYIRSYVYAKDLEVNKEGVAVLLNTRGDDEVKVLWVSPDGSRQEKVTYKGMKLDQIDVHSPMAIAPQEARIYFLNRMEGMIYKAEWPF